MFIYLYIKKDYFDHADVFRQRLIIFWKHAYIHMQMIHKLIIVFNSLK